MGKRWDSLICVACFSRRVIFLRGTTIRNKMTTQIRMSRIVARECAFQAMSLRRLRSPSVQRA